MARPRRRLLVVAAVVVVVLGAVAAGLALASGDDGSSRYRTAAAVRGAVESTVSGSGTIRAVNRASLAFPVAGTVASVQAAVGQHVVVGQTLATLDTTSLRAQLAQARSTLAAARNRLSADEAGQSGGGASPGAQPGVTGSAFVAPAGGAAHVVPAVATTGTSRTVTAAAPDPGTSIPDLQAQLLADQHRTDTDLAAARSALAAATTACRGPGAQPSDFVTDLGTGALARPATATATPTPTPPTGGPAGGGAAGGGTAGGSARSSVPTTASPPNGPGPGNGLPGMSAGCASALEAVLARQATVAQDQQTVAIDETALDRALAASVRTGPGGSAGSGGSAGTAGPGAGANGSGVGQGAGTGQGTGTGSGAGTGSGSAERPGGSAGGADAGGPTGRPGTAPRAGGGAPGNGSAARGSTSTPGGGAGRGGSATPRTGSTGGAVSAAQLAADQAEVDADQAQVDVVQQSIDQATIVSPIEGTVGAVDLTVGRKVGAAADGQIVVLGPGSDEATVGVNDVTVGLIKVGQRARVTPNGSGAPMTGTVTSVGLLDTSSSGPASYDVTIGLPGPATQPDGRGASVAVVTAQVADAVAVPSSAVRTDGTSQTVTVLSGGEARPVPVRVGAVGAGLTEILSGVDPGDAVVIADLTRPLPSADLRTLGGGRPG